MASETVKEAVTAQFAGAAEAYASSEVFVGGPDLEAMRATAMLQGHERVLDIGAGAGHTALFFAPGVRRVDAIDLAGPMLTQGRRLATERGLENVHWHRGEAEALPFADASFDIVTSRQSAHHFPDLSAALCEAHRVLRGNGRFILVDTVAPEDHAGATFLNAFEVLRDSSHVRDHAVSDWVRMLGEAGFEARVESDWKLDLSFGDWVRRSATPVDAIDALRAFVGRAPREISRRFFPEPERCDRLLLDTRLIVASRH